MVFAESHIGALPIQTSNSPTMERPYIFAGMQKKTFLPSKEALGPSDAQRAILHQRCARWRALKPLLKLGVMEWDCLFELAPLTPYELLRRGLGDFSTKKAARTQTGDDTHTEEVQTNDVSLRMSACSMLDSSSKAFSYI